MKELSEKQKAVMEDNKKRRKYKRCSSCGLKVKSERHDEGLAHKRRKV